MLLAKRRSQAARSDNPDHWAYTPDVDNPKSWRLPLTDADGEWDARAIAAALGCLSPDAHPTIPAKAHRSVRAKIRAAWQAVHPDAELPAVLRKADVFAPSPIDDDGMPRGVMIAIVPDDKAAQALAIDGGLPPSELHVTLCYLGPLGYLSADDVDDLPAVIRDWAVRCEVEPVQAVVTGWAVFETDTPDEAPAVALVSADGLGRLRASLIEHLNVRGYVAWSDYEFVPHITLGYGPWLTTGTLPDRTEAVAFTAGEILIVAAGQVTRVPLDGRTSWQRVEDWMHQDAVYLSKSAAKRYTLAPLYVPERADTHGEFASADDLEEAVWEYMRSGQFDVNYEHVSGTRAGECVGIICWPFEETVTMSTGAGDEYEVTIPAGTVYQGVVWEEWAWPLVERGEINALSMEGWAARRKVTV